MKIVLALGGNALGNNPEEQLSLVKDAAKSFVDLIADGHQLVITHGNGPQVGMINNALPSMPFPECGAMSQGYIGYHLQNAIQAELSRRQIQKEVATIVTQVVVDANDPSFQKPTKPIGPFYSEAESETLSREQGFTMVEDSGRGYRRVVPSPKPIDVVEKNIVRTLVDAGVIVVTVGGGGIPVVKDDNHYVGVPAVIDKDFASAKIAELIDADYLFILTAIDRVMINYNQPDQRALDVITVAEARQYIREGHFAPGSMLPKVEASIQFVEGHPKRHSVIAALEKTKEALQGKSGTRIIA